MTSCPDSDVPATLSGSDALSSLWRRGRSTGRDEVGLAIDRLEEAGGKSLADLGRALDEGRSEDAATCARSLAALASALDSDGLAASCRAFGEDAEIGFEELEQSLREAVTRLRALRLEAEEESDGTEDDAASLDRRADEIFDQALDLPADERAAFVEEACADNDEVRARVERLLSRIDRPMTALEDGPRLAALFSVDDEPELGEPGPGGAPRRVGPYRIVREIGRGGMGVVYLAERADGHFQQQVAVKVMRPGSDSLESRRRFERERQIIASLQHPNIARLLDGGVTDDGRPYSAMEYVEGQPIDAYCRENRLSLDARLVLLEHVGAAVHYAHQNLVVHRDLKPSNILVTPDGEVKLLDFGIAKLLEVAGPDATLLTRTGGMPITPVYASPEQLTGDAVTTASDVYQLGLLAFELLTGVRARDASSSDGSASSSYRAFAVPAPRLAPSAAVRKMLPKRAERVAAARRTTRRGLLRALRDDLDLIVQSAMRPEPDRRYPSAAEFAEDLRRHRSGDALAVRAESWTSRARGFLRRHRLGVAVAAGFVLLLLAYSVTVTVQAQRIRAERDRAERLQAFALGLYGAGDPNEGLGADASAADLLEHGLSQAESELEDEPEILANVKTQLAHVFVRLGREARAEELYRQSLDLLRSVHGDRHPEIARTLNWLGRTLLRRDDPEALIVLQEALEQTRHFGESDGDDEMGDEDAAGILVDLGYYLRSTGRYEESETHFRQALDLLGQSVSEPTFRASALLGLAWTVRFDGRPEEAEPLVREALQIYRGLYGDVHPRVGVAWNDLSVVLWQLERWQEGDEAVERSLDVKRKLLGDEHPDLAVSLSNWAGSLRRRGELNRAADLFQQALELRRAAYGKAHLRVGQSLSLLAETRRRQGRLEEAESLFRQAEETMRASVPEGHSTFGRLWREYGILLTERGRLGEARTVLEGGLGIYQSMPESRWVPRLQILLATVDRLQGKPEAASSRLDAVEGEIQSDEWLERLQEERAALSTSAELGED